MPMNYKVIRDSFYQSFENEVNSHLSSGQWKLHGDTQVLLDGNGDFAEVMYFQALVRQEPFDVFLNDHPDVKLLYENWEVCHTLSK